MAAVFPDVGKKLMLDILLASGRNPKLKLYKNSGVTPGAGTVLGDFTEADFSGYAAVDLSSIGAATINGSDQGERHKDDATFTHNSGSTHNTVYGWYVVIDNLSSSAELFLAQQFPAAQVLDHNGAFVQFDWSILDELGT